MSKRILIIDPQNDFMDQPDAALPVSGSVKSANRLSQFIENNIEELEEITVTLDSHSYFSIERTSFWQDSEGNEAKPFTVLNLEAVKSGKLRFVTSNETIKKEVLDTLVQMEKLNKSMTIWPVHCVVGSKGHAIEPSVREALNKWEAKKGQSANYVFKGLNNTTEHFSAIKAEVPKDDPRTEVNKELVEFMNKPGTLFVAGQASSHCVKLTVEYFLEEVNNKPKSQIVLLSDCMNPVSGFESNERELFANPALKVTTTDKV